MRGTKQKDAELALCLVFMADPRHNAHHALTYPVSGYPSRPILRPTLPLHPIALSVSTSTVASELDPNEQTARPGNAHNHRLFLDGLSAPASAPAPAPAKPDPGATPVDARPPAVALSRPFSSEEEERLAHLDSFKFFLATAPSQWSGGRPPSLSFAVGSSSGWTTPPDGHTHAAHLSLNRFLLPSQEFVTCIFWNGLYHITGTDIVRALVFRFEVSLFISLFPHLPHLPPGIWPSCPEYEKVRGGRLQ